MNEPIQTAYIQNIGKAYAGMLADSGHTDKYSYTAETNLRYGAGVQLSAAGDPEREVELYASPALSVRGVVIREQVREAQLPALAGLFGAGETYYVPATHTASILLKGRIYVTVDEDVTAGQGAWCKKSTSVLGGWAASNVGADYAQVTGAMFVTTAASGELAILELS